MPTPNGQYRSLLTHWPTYTTGSDMGDMGVQKGIRLGVKNCYVLELVIPDSVITTAFTLLVLHTISITT